MKENVRINKTYSLNEDWNSENLMKIMGEHPTECCHDVFLNCGSYYLDKYHYLEKADTNSANIFMYTCLECGKRFYLYRGTKEKLEKECMVINPYGDEYPDVNYYREMYFKALIHNSTEQSYNIVSYKVRKR